MFLEKNGDSGYRIGQLLLVIEIVLSHNRTYLRAYNGAFSPYIVDFCHYKIVSKKIPSNWIVQSNNECSIGITAARWSKNNFWIGYNEKEPWRGFLDAYIDGEPCAERIYKEEISIMLTEDPLPK